ncbi:MAG TPA: hypothetical protein VI413_14685 [Paludibacter sp.]
MKIYVVFLLLLASLAVNAQSNAGTSVVVQKVDSVQMDRLITIENNLTSFHHANRTSQFFIFAGSALTVTGALLSSSSSEPNVLPLFGVISSLIGGVIYLDSYKYLNINKNKKKVATSIKNDFY